MAIAEFYPEHRSLKGREGEMGYGVTINRIDSNRTRHKSKNSKSCDKSRQRRPSFNAKKRKVASFSFQHTRKPVSYVKLVQSTYQKLNWNKEIEEMSFPDLLDASHVLSIAQNERLYNLNNYSKKVVDFVQKAIDSRSVDKYLAALNQQIVLRIGEQR